MIMAQSPIFKIYTARNEYIGAVKHAEDAACLVALHGAGATIRLNHRFVVWHEGKEHIGAAESYDEVASTIQSRLDALWGWL